MRQAGIRAKQARRFKATTDSRHSFPIAPNRLQRRFQIDGPDRCWLGDITHVPIRQGWLYVAAMLDLYSRRVVGWSMSSRMTADLTIRALVMAMGQRNPAKGLIHHTDRGGQYAGRAYRALLERHDMQASMSRKGDVYDNAVMESFFGTLKKELIHDRLFSTRDQARAEIFDYVEVSIIAGVGTRAWAT